MRKKSAIQMQNYQKFRNNIHIYENRGLNIDEIFEIKEAFDFIDNNGSGSISRKEFVEAKSMMKFEDQDTEKDFLGEGKMKKLGGDSELTDENIFDEMLKVMDKDGSGGVDFDEFFSVFTNEKEKRMDRKLYYKDLFALFCNEDDKRARLSFEDLKKIVIKIEEEIEEDELREMFDRADEDKDGFVGVEEFVKFMCAA